MDGAAGPLGRGSFGDVLLGWALAPREPDESVVLWQSRCRAGPQLAIKRIRPLPTVVSTKLSNALAPVQGLLKAKSKFLAASKRRRRRRRRRQVGGAPHRRHRKAGL